LELVAQEGLAGAALIRSGVKGLTAFDLHGFVEQDGTWRTPDPPMTSE
jgi:hypothetical protein